MGFQVLNPTFFDSIKRPPPFPRKDMDTLTSLVRRRLSIKSSTHKSDMISLDRQNGERLTARLPPEILVVIFSLLDRNSRELARVTAVCARWRAIAVQIPYLWTHIVVELKDLDKKQAKQLFSRVDLFLSRTSDLLLDVEWHTAGKAKFISLFYTLFKQKGTFNRWKTLTLDMNPALAFPSREIREVDKFSSLESLKFVSTPPLTFLEIVSTTASTKLHTLHLHSRFQCSPNFFMEYSRLLGFISTLCVWNHVILPPGAILPNVTTLQANMLPNISMPHVRHLFVRNLVLKSFHGFDPESLVSLSIHRRMTHVVTGLTISFPRLLWLKLGDTACDNIGVFKVPSLHTLSIKWGGKEAQTFDGPFVTGLCGSFKGPKLLMLFLNVFLDSQSTLAILKQFLDVSRVELYFQDTSHAQETLSDVFPDQRDVTFCPNLDVLHVFLTAPPTNVNEWQDSVRKIASNIGEPLWKLESNWPDGAYSHFINEGVARRNVPYIHPWKTSN